MCTFRYRQKETYCKEAMRDRVVKRFLVAMGPTCIGEYTELLMRYRLRDEQAMARKSTVFSKS